MCIYSGNKTGSCLVDSMESIGNVFKEKTKFLNTMYVYHTVRKPGYILVAWHSGRTSVSGRRTFRPALDLQLMGDH